MARQITMLLWMANLLIGNRYGKKYKIFMMNYKKIIFAIVFIIAGIIVTALFWRNTLLLSCLLIILAIVKHSVVPIKMELLWFVLVGILGTTTESLIMYLGGSPWSYASSSFFNFPFWLIFLWGLAGIIFITLHQGVSKWNRVKFSPLLV